MDYTHTLPLVEEEVDYLAAFGRREKLNAILSKGPADQDKPIAVRQRAAYVRGGLVSIGDCRFMYWFGEAPIRRVPLGLIEPDKQASLALIAADLAGDRSLMDMLDRHIKTHDLQHDRFMMNTAVFEIFHMPHGLVFGWEMDSPRRKKLCTHIAGGSEVSKNNPAAALGVMLSLKPETNHDRIREAARQLDMAARYQLITTAAFGANLTIKAPGSLHSPA